MFINWIRHAESTNNRISIEEFYEKRLADPKLSHIGVNQTKMCAKFLK